METKNKVGAFFFTLILLTFIIGGYFLMDYLTDQNHIFKRKDPGKIEEIADFRIDKSKDYIYYENTVEVLPSMEISNYDVVLNFTTMSETNSKLKQDLEAIKQNVKYIKDVEIPEGTEYAENDEGIYSVEYRDYEDYAFDKYISLLILDYTYDVINGIKPTNLESYVIDKTTGERIMPDILLKNYNLDMDQVKAKVRQRLVDTQTLNGDVDIDGTMNNFNTFAFYINKTGKLSITFVVKSSKTYYNDSIEIS